MMAAVKSRRESLWLFALFFCYALAMLLATAGSRTVAESARGGMRLAVEIILPSVLPFMIFSEIVVAVIDFSQLRRTGGLFGRAFGLSASALGAIVIGTLAGFPIGARMVADAYRSSALSRDEAERAVVIASTPSLAFTVSGVGGGMLGDTRMGLALYFSVVAASLLYGFLTRRGSVPTVAEGRKKQRLDLSRSISSAATACLGIIVTVTLFSVVTGLLCEVAGESTLLSLILPFIEVSTACSRLCGIGGGLSLILVAFALGFSGLSVHLQIRSALADTDLGYSRFLRGKLVIGLLAAAIFSILQMLIK